MNMRLKTYGGRHASKGSLIPSKTANPFIPRSDAGIRSNVLLQPPADISERLGPKQINRIEKLAVLEQVAVAVPEPRDNEAVSHLGVGTRPRIVAADLSEEAVCDGEAARRRLRFVLGTNPLVAIGLGRGGAGERLLALQREGEGDGGEDGEDEAAAHQRGGSLCHCAGGGGQCSRR